MLAFLFLTAIAGPEPDPAPPKAPFAGADIRALIARMTDVKASFQERCGAEDELEKRRPQDVLPRLLPELAKGMPPGGIWNGLGSREANRHGPVRWQIWYAVHRVWDRHVGALPAAEAGKELLSLLRGSGSDRERIHLLSGLTHCWDSDAEADLAGLLGDAGETVDIRQGAALPLIVHGKGDYRDVLLKWAGAAADAREKQRWFDLLSDPVHRKRKGFDPRVVRLGFQLIQDERTSSPGFIHGAYFLAGKVGAYVGEEFAPSTGDPRYADRKGGLSDRYFVDTVQNAVRWWQNNRERFEKMSRPDK
ncbi:MAG: hypothetical protein U0793_31165 [Gemmataceae bacterium]